MFSDPDVVHVEGKIAPGDDIDTINTELILADLQTLEKAVPRLEKESRKDKDKAALLDAAVAAQKVLDEALAPLLVPDARAERERLPGHVIRFTTRHTLAGLEQIFEQSGMKGSYVRKTMLAREDWKCGSAEPTWPGPAGRSRPGRGPAGRGRLGRVRR